MSYNLCYVRIFVHLFEFTSAVQAQNFFREEVWNSFKQIFETYLFETSKAGFVNPKLPVAKVRPVDFKDAAKRACGVRHLPLAEKLQWIR
ncbi:hypothetical protein FRX31_024301 [Thalictrum thalictroides]|uniref:Uncharacterized protein n=1 Tax=Thalictrum thalictroides TaxID=46969 RepID=A0A7J6VMG5_THATH|nr:hypothetical protein FRX31_024301 [Thalictrum thalictroides]